MCINPTSWITSRLIFCTSITRIGILFMFTQAVSLSPIIIRGRNEFVPCTYERDPTDMRAHILVCDEDASREFGQQLPIIQADQIALSQIRIRGTTDIIRCPDYAFQNANVDLDKARGQLGSVVRVVEIIGTSLTQIEPKCLDGLFTVRELRILNAPGSEHTIGSSQLAQNLFHALQGLRNLEFLHLMHVDLSGGIPANGLGNWTEELRRLYFEYNRLQQIDKDAFKRTGLHRSVLTELRIEAQPEAWRLVKNMRDWARHLTSLRILSWKRSQLQPPNDEGEIRVDLGEAVNSQLVSLNLDDCGLLRLVSELSPVRLSGLSLQALGPHLQELSINQNHFASQELVDQSLFGLRSMSNLRMLRIEYNKTPLNRLPEWFSYGGLDRLRELRLRNSGLITISAAAFPPSLESLHLSANPLRYVDAEWMNNNKQGLIELHMNHIRLASVDVGGHWADWARALKQVAGTLQLFSLAGCQIEPAVLDEPTTMQWKTKHLENNETSGKPTVRLGLRDLKQLRTLILNDNELTYIPPNAFRELTKLRHLVLAGNRLGSIAQWEVNKPSFVSKLTGRHRMQRIDLRFNYLQTLDRCASDLGLGEPLEDMLPQRPTWLAGENVNTNGKSEYVNDLKVGDTNRDIVSDTPEWFGGLSLTGNPFVCDCRLAWLRLYILQMDRHVTQSMADNALPLGYRTYRTEALDFVCAEVGPWRGRNFLTLKPIDLYAARHDHCQQRPDIYGNGEQMEQALIPCREVLIAHADDNIAPHQGRIRFTADYKRDNRTNRTTASQAANVSFYMMGMSMEAFILVVVAGVASLCFFVISIIIIVWLCVRLRRQENLHKHRIYSRGNYASRGGNPPMHQRSPLPCTCCLCTRCTRHSATTATTLSSSNSTAVLKQHLLVRNTRNQEGERRSSDVGSEYESYYSQMSDQEIGKLIATVPQLQAAPRSICNDETEQIPITRKQKKNYRTATKKNQVTSQQINDLMRYSESDADHLPRNNSKSDDTKNHLIVNEPEDVRSTLSLNEDPKPRPARPLPPVPAQRKTKSIANIQTNLIDQFGTSLPYDPYHQAVSLNALSTAGIDSDRQSRILGEMILQTSKHATSKLKPRSTVNRSDRYTDGGVRYIHEKYPSTQLSRTRLTKSTGQRPNVMVPINRPYLGSGSNWLRASRKKLERSLDRFRRQKSYAPTKSNIQEQVEPEIIEYQKKTKIQEVDEEEHSKRMQGPDLPRPQFIIATPNRNLPQTISVGAPHEYLPMQTSEHEQPSDSPPTKHQNLKNNDEYVTELAEHEPTLLRSRPLKRHPSKSEGEHPAEPSASLRNRPLRLFGNLYTLSLYDDAPSLGADDDFDTLDLPPPPPPPLPSKMMVKIPPSAWTRQKPVTDKPSSLTCTVDKANRTEREVGEGKKNTSKSVTQQKVSQKLQPPVAPKPRNLEAGKTMPEKTVPTTIETFDTSVNV